MAPSSGACSPTTRVEMPDFVRNSVLGGLSGLDCNAEPKRSGFTNPVESGKGLPSNPLNPLKAPKGLDLPALLLAWSRAFGSTPVRSSAVLHRAKSTPALADALGTPLPSGRSLGRLLAAREGVQAAGYRLARCLGRHDNCALWRLQPVDLDQQVAAATT